LFEEFHSELVEDIVENDEALLEKFFEEGEEGLTQEELMNTLHVAFENDTIVPILIGSSIKNIGVERLLTALKDFGEKASERKFKDINGEDIIPDVEGKFVGLVVKNDVDPFVGKLTYVRVLSGIVKSASSIYVVQEETSEKAAHIYIPQHDKNLEVDEAIPGDVVVIPKLKSTKIGQTLSDSSAPVTVKIPEFPEPMISKSINPKSKNEIDKITGALSKLAESDLTFSWEFDPETAETVINGIGAVHLDVMTARLKQNFGVDFEVGKPKIAYRETVRKDMKGEHKHKKQTGGHGQYGHVKLEIFPLERGSGYEFVDKIVGGVIPKNYIPSCDKGIQEALKDGVVAGFPVVDVKVVLYDGSYHDVDSSDIAFQIAARTAFKDAMKKATPVILEPVMQVEVFVPSENTGDVMGEVTAKRGRPMGMEATGKGYDKINAEIPLAEMMDFSPRLNSISSGKGYFTMKFANYSEVGPDIQQKIITERKEAIEEK
jgi:elongation factor G